MLITCAACSTQFQLDDERVPVEGIRVRCSICKHAFFVPHPDAIEVEVDDPLEQAVAEALAGGAAAEADVAHDLDEAGPEARAGGEPPDESWEFDDDGRLSEPARGGPPERRFEESFAAARSAVDDLLGNPEPDPVAAPVRVRPGALASAAAVAPTELAAESAETWTAPDEPGASEVFDEPAAPHASAADGADWAADPGGWDEPVPWDAEAAAAARAPLEAAVAEPPAEDWDAGAPEVDDFEDPLPEAEAPIAEAAADAAPSGIYDEIGGLASPEEPAEPASAGDEDADLEADEAPSDSDLDFEELDETAGAPAPAVDDDEDMGLGSGWDLGDDEAAQGAEAPAWRAAAQGAPSEARSGVEVPIGLGAPLDLGEPRGVRAAVQRAGHAAGWAAVAALVAVALWGTVGPGRAPQAAPATQAVAGLEATGIAGRWVESALAGPVYVVSGELRNPGPDARAPGARVVVRLLDEAGASLAEAAASAAPPLAAEQLREASPEQLRAAAEQGARALATTPLAPGAHVPFEAVLVALPDQARRFELAAIPLHPSNEAGQGG